MSGKPRQTDEQALTAAQQASLKELDEAAQTQPANPKSRKNKSGFASQAQRRIEELFSDLDEEFFVPEVSSPPPQAVERPRPIERSKVEKPRAEKPAVEEPAEALQPAPLEVEKPEPSKPEEIQSTDLAITTASQPEPVAAAAASEPEPSPSISPPEPSAVIEAQEPEPLPPASPPAASYEGTKYDLQALEPDEQVAPASEVIPPGRWKSLQNDTPLVQDADLNRPAMPNYSRGLDQTDQIPGVELLETSITPSQLLEIVDNDPGRRWSEDELLLIEQVTDQLALALENAQLFEQTQKARDALQISVRYQKSVADAVAILSERGFAAISEVLQILGAASQASRAYYLETQYDHRGPYWRLISEWHAPDLSSQTANPALRKLAPEAMRNWTDRLGREGSLACRRSSASPEERLILEALGVQSLLHFPVAGQQETPGCIGFEQADYERVWSNEETAALQTAASALANTIVRENLFNQLQVNLSETEAQYQASAQLNSANSSEEILSILRQFTILGHLNASNVTIYSFNHPWTRSRKPDWLLPVARWSALEIQETPLERYPLSEWRNPEALFSPDRPTIVFDIASDPRLDEMGRSVFAEGMGAKSLLIVPLNVSGRWIGQIIALYSQTTGFTEREVRRLVSLAGQAGVAVESLRLLDETRQRNDELLAMNQVTSAVSRTLELDQVLSEILQRVLAITEFDGGLISYLDTDTQQLTLAVHHNLPHEMVDKLYEKGLDGTPCDLVLKIGMTINVPDMDNLPKDVLELAGLLPPSWPHAGIEPAFAGPKSRGFRSYLGVPLSAKGIQLGTVCLFGKSVMIVPSGRIALTEAIGQQVGVAVDNARLFQSTQIALGESEALYQASSEFNSVQSYEEILLSLRRYTILGKTDKLLSIALFDHPWFIRGKERQTGRLPSLDELKPPEWVQPIAHWSSLPPESRLERSELRHFPAANLLSPSDLTIIEDVSSDPRLEKDDRQLFQESFQANSIVFLPLSLGNQWIGFIFSAFSVPLIFDEMEVRRLNAIAGQAAVAIQNLRLLDESRRRANQLQTAAEIARDTSGTLALDNLLQRTVSQITERFGFYHASIFLIDESGKEAIVRESTGLAGEEMKRDGHRLVVGGRSVIGQVTANGKSLVLNDVNSEEARHIHHHNPLLPFTRAELGIPLKIGEQVIGALDVQSDMSNAFSEDDIAVLQTLSDQIAVAVDNATSYELAQKAVEEIREADRLKTQFLANMSHELRTPLNSIIGFSRVILKGIDGPINEQQIQDLTAIYNSGQHLLGLINDVLDVSRIEAGKMDLAFEPNINLADTIHSVMSTTVGLVKDKPIELKQNIDPELPLVTADPMKIRQVLINLLSNAAKFTDNGSITVEAERYLGPDGEPQVIVRVIDTGPGIAPKDQAKLFQPFSQVDGSLTRRTGGSGLGLSICSHLIRMHDGQIGLESEVGKGSTFYFTIPVSQPLWVDESYGPPEVRPAPTPVISKPAAVVEEAITGTSKEEAVANLELPDQGGEKDLDGSLEAAAAEADLGEVAEEPATQPHTFDFDDVVEEIDEEVTEKSAEIPAAAETENPPAANVPKKTGPLLILAIEQDHKVIDLYKRYLAGSNCTVISLTRLEQTVNVARGIQPFAITLDISMNGSDRQAGTGPLLGPIYRKDGADYLDGLKVLKDLKSDPGTRHIPVIVCSVLAEHEKAYKLGAADYLLKPILEEDLIQAIRRLQANNT